ncbi:MAG: cupin domain-containing protein [Xanthomonadales bacterium]|nr:cupin domain-containing protein [Xanthomonadales bacterium]NIP12650.1 cupin domain-containing protein [Xanthomonadales bacterium]
MPVLLLLAFPCMCLAEAVPGAREVLLDNPAVEVVRLTYPVGSESGMHTHAYPNRVAYVVQGGTLELIPGDPAAPRQELTLSDGQAVFLAAATHNVRNAGDTEIVMIEIELK